jgi:hypothetical protein
MAWYAKFDGVEGESRSTPNVSEIVVTKDIDSAVGMNVPSWGLDRIDQRASAADDPGPFFAYGDGTEAHAGGLIRLEIMYAPVSEPDPVGGFTVTVTDVEEKGLLLYAGYHFG